MESKAIILGYIKRELLHGCKKNIMESDDLLSTGIIDSLGIQQLIIYIENQFNILIPDEDVVFENFYSVEAINNYLQNHN